MKEPLAEFLHTNLIWVSSKKFTQLINWFGKKHSPRWKLLTFSIRVVINCASCNRRTNATEQALIATTSKPRQRLNCRRRHRWNRKWILVSQIVAWVSRVSIATTKVLLTLKWTATSSIYKSARLLCSQCRNQSNLAAKLLLRRWRKTTKAAMWLHQTDKAKHQARILNFWPVSCKSIHLLSLKTKSSRFTRLIKWKVRQRVRRARKIVALRTTSSERRCKLYLTKSNSIL